ncbi:MAG TPA: sporulation initiation factor Spo0A C-terminal domain-containing protein [Candidatus Mediterraneibacter intestinipullorum]|nr:sporulation initiation factor Spo0A C-terminal domain-containing protein [Candidatus Mediterraneibacter intestinipullorum]
MNYEKVIISTLDSFGVNRSYTGYDYVVHGLLLIIDNRNRLDCITKTLYLDIASHFHTSWNCVEKNMRTIVTSVWNSHNAELLETVFNKSNRNKKPTNKAFLRYMYDYVIRTAEDTQAEERCIPVPCPLSNECCDSLRFYCLRQSRIIE